VEHILQQYDQAFTTGFSDFFAGIETDGVAHFGNLFDAIRTMYTQLVADLVEQKLMSKLLTIDPKTGQASGLLSGGVGAGIGGALVGFGTGQSSGIFGGVAAGALAGAAIPGGGPFTAILGAVSGLVGGLFGEAEQARQAEEALHAAQQKFGVDLQAFVDAANGVSTPLSQAIAQVQAQAAQLRQEAIAAHGQTGPTSGTDDLVQLQAELAVAQRLASLNGAAADAERDNIAALEAEIAAINDINMTEAQRTAEVTAQDAALKAFTLQDYEVRLLQAKGLTDQADALQLLLTQQQEYTQAVQDHADATTLAAIQEVQLAETRRAALDKLQTQITSLSTTIDDLTKFQTDLKLGSLTALSPIQQLQAARSQYQDVLSQARAGDQTAAQQLPNVANAFLQASRAVNASGGRYQADFTTVLTDAAAVQQLFAGQRSAAQQQIDVLQQELNALQDIGAAIAHPQPMILERSPADILQAVADTNQRLDAMLSVLQVGFLTLDDSVTSVESAVQATGGQMALKLEGTLL
jgi:hypothetical protein